MKNDLVKLVLDNDPILKRGNNKPTYEEFREYIQYLVNKVVREYRDDRMVQKITNAIARKGNIKFKINEKGLKEISSDVALYYNYPAHQFHRFITILNECFPDREFDGINKFALIRSKDKVSKDDLELFHHAIQLNPHVGLRAAINDSGIFDERNTDEIEEYKKKLIYTYFYIPGESVLDLSDDVLRFYMLLVMYSLLEKYGFTVTR